uniref:lasso peptide biosynthesis PqqD family chaperone n=1 Tax=Pseudonocardia sp. CA-138482 TaxID=3240023 RepID=UPI003F49A631
MTETDGGLVLLNERTGQYWQLNATGGAVLRHLLDSQPPEQVAQHLATRYSLPVSQAQHDVTAVINQLRAARLIEGG